MKNTNICGGCGSAIGEGAGKWQVGRKVLCCWCVTNPEILRGMLNDAIARTDAAKNTLAAREAEEGGIRGWLNAAYYKEEMGEGRK